MLHRLPMPLCFLLAILTSLAVLVPPAVAQEVKPAPRAEKTDKDKEKNDKDEPVEKVSKTRHTLLLAGKPLPYTATAGNAVLRDYDGKAKASIFYVSYVRDGVKDPAERPVTFCFNGGPGAASLWVHLGAFGPKKVERDAEGMALGTPGRLVDNPDTMLDVSDLVFIDPVNTGYSRPAPGEEGKQFHGLQEDIEWVGEFIRLWVTRNQRWASPKLIAGESYGTARAAGLAFFLADRFGMAVNGIVLLSTVLNWQNQEFHVGNDMPYIIHLPSYAVTAWYHKKLPPELSGDLPKLLAEVEDYARGEYASALMQGDRLPEARKREVAARLARYTGLSTDYILRTDLRIDMSRFTKELLRAEGKTVGRLDSRFTGRDLDSVGETPEFDPSSVSLDGPYTAAINDYLRRELKYEDDAVYERLSRRVWPWNYGEFDNRYVNMAEVLRSAMTRNPKMQVLVASGYYDFATPYLDAVYTVEHMGLPPELRGNVRLTFYEAGHMMYIRRADHEKLKGELVELVRRATAR